MFDSLTQNSATENGLVTVRNTLTKQVEKIAFATSVQVGLSSYPTELQILGRLSLASKDIKINDNEQYLAKNDSTIYNVDTSKNSSGVTLILPDSPRLGQILVVKDSSGTSSSFPISITGNSNHTIDGQTSKIINTAYGSMIFIWQGNQWSVLTTTVGFYSISSYNSSETISENVDFAKINSTGGSFTLNLELSPKTGRNVIVKDTAGFTGTNNVIISGNGKTIDGSPSITISTNYAAVNLVYSGSEWSII